MSIMNGLYDGHVSSLADLQARLDAMAASEKAAGSGSISGGRNFAGAMGVSGIVLDASVTPAERQGAGLVEPPLGFLGGCIDAGVPRDLLIALCPGVAGDSKTGKTPSFYHPESGTWRNKRVWQNGKLPPAELNRANAEGGNAGLALGVAAKGRKYISGDIDTNAGPEAVQTNRIIANAITEAFGCPNAAERTSFPYRSMFLVSLPDTEEVGSVENFNVLLPNADGNNLIMPAPVCTVQLLGKGHQCAIAGNHWSGNTMTWRHGGQTYLAPPMAAPGAVIEVASWQALIDGMAKVGALLEAQGFQLTRSLPKVEKGDAPEMEDLGAPSVRDMTGLLNAIQNPTSIGYERYCQIMMAISGAYNGLRSVSRLTLAEDNDIGLAVAGWMSRYVPPPGKFAPSLEDALEEWQRYWGAIHADQKAGWPHLVGRARDLGLPPDVFARLDADCQMRKAQLAYAAEYPPDPIDGPVDGETPERILDRMHPSRREAAEARGDRDERDFQWTDRLKRSDKDKVLSHIQNIFIALKFAPDFDGVFRWNDFSSQILISARPPWVHKDELRGAPFEQREMRDVDIPLLMVWLSSKGIQASKQNAMDGILMEAYRHRFHPVKDYLASLTWDGKPRIALWLVDHLGAEDNELNRAFGRKWLLSGVARIMQPGCKVDTSLLLEGRQGLRKSSALKVLGGDYFTDDMPDLSTKDALLHMQGSWIIEFPENAVIERSDARRAKAFMSTATDKFRAPYGRVTEAHPRQCVFGITVNPEVGGYLRDSTGGRRLWPVLCGVGWEPEREIDVPAVAAVRDQLWAEAVHEFNAGEPWWIEDAALQQVAAENVDARYDDDPWQPRVLEFLHQRRTTTTSDILSSVIYPNRNLGDWKRSDSTKVGIILKAAKWVRGRDGTGDRGWGYDAPAGWVVVQPPEQDTGFKGEVKAGPMAGL